MKQACGICNNAEGNKLHTVREMAFGLREPFAYLECANCGCLQLLEIPANMGKYYPPDYYSFQKHGWLKTYIRRQWSAFAAGRRNLPGQIISHFFIPNQAMQAVVRSGVPKTGRILDVGCGSGRLLLDLAYLGYQDLTGADPFIAQDLFYPNGVKVFRKGLGEMSGPFDLIMLHHSFEHMDRPEEVMRQIARLLQPEGKLVLRIPVASSYAWRRYGANWINLDAPRHFFLHTFKSIDLLAQPVSLRVTEIIHEGNDQQFWGSEQFAQDIPSNDPRSLGSSPLKRLFAWKRFRDCRRRAKKLNDAKQGDLVCFHLLRSEGKR